MNVKRPDVSIVVPTYNEAGNVELLIERLAKTLSRFSSAFEIIVVDDFSNDGTFEKATAMKRDYPVRVYLKEGKRGKAFSLLQGFRLSVYEIVGFIDADLQYAPETIGKMITPIADRTADIVVANRMYDHDQPIRRFISKSFRLLFGRLLHGFSVDVQSGLKLFRREVIERMNINPSQWTFDLEFLLQARTAGYSIYSIPMPFANRHSGESKVKTIRTSLEIGLSSIKLRFKPIGPIPFSVSKSKRMGYGFHFRGMEYMHFTPLSFKESAFSNLNKPQAFTVLLLGSVLTKESLLNWHATAVVCMAIITAVYFFDLLFYLFLVYRSMKHAADLSVTDEDTDSESRNWPTYTVLCPLYKEWRVIPQFIKAMQNLDYPKDKLQVMLLLEEDDTETIQAVRSMTLPHYFDTILVPDTKPKTKPKACNYGLHFSKGEFSVIFDAEDVPDPKQLKKAVVAFEKSDPDVVCVQAKLAFYNPNQNFLTRIFSAEYALWFYIILSGLQNLDAPIPLGGTSNHFRTSLLKNLNGWDSFNVAEDADIGVRLAKFGYKTILFNSVTMEEANSDLKNWIAQRSRWIKGYIQTYLVHMRKPSTFVKSGKSHQLVYLQLVVGGKILLILINPLMWITTIAYFTARSSIGGIIESLFPPAVFYMGVFSFIFGNFLYAYYYAIACLHKKQYELVKYTIFVPIYWLLMSLAGWIAFVQYLIKPHFWAKTKHGFHLQQASPALSAVPA